MERPFVSILIDNFGYGRYLPRSIGSALAQTYPRLEVVVVDDASRDDSAEVIRGFGDRVVPVLRERNGGQGAAFNSGVQACRGDLVMLLDSDDWLHPHAAERVVAAWRPGVAQVQHRLDLVDAGGCVLDTYPAPELRFDGGDVTRLLLARGRYQTTVTSGLSFARPVLERILPVPEDRFRISADGYLVLAAPFHGAVVSIDESLGAYCQHGSNAWADGVALPPQELGKRMRRSLEHDRERLTALQAEAARAGRAVEPDAELRDHQHLSARLASLRLAPGEHPSPGDRPSRLGWLGARAVLATRQPLARRLVLAAWFVLCGILPRRLAIGPLSWGVAPSTRPPLLRGFLRRLRRLIA